MKLRESVTIIFVSIIALLSIVGYVSSFFLGDDNTMEETCEGIIKAQTNMDVDLTPITPETVTDQSDATDLCDSSVDVTQLPTVPSVVPTI